MMNQESESSFVHIPLKRLNSMQEVLFHGGENPTFAAWACGAVYIALEIIKKGAMKDETV